jgi:hypothetical protein
MNLKDRFAEFVLAAFDRFMDFITLGTWTRVRGSVVPQVKITKRRN